MRYKLVYVCHNNKGRSIALATYTKHFLKERGIENVAVDSAGIFLDSIESLRERKINYASRTTILILKHEGFDIEEHRVKHVEEVIEGSNLILVSDELSLAKTRADFPDYKKTSFLAREYACFSRRHEIFGPHASYRKLRTSH